MVDARVLPRVTARSLFSCIISSCKDPVRGRTTSFGTGNKPYEEGPVKAFNRPSLPPKSRWTGHKPLPRNAVLKRKFLVEYRGHDSGQVSFRRAGAGVEYTCGGV